MNLYTNVFIYAFALTIGQNCHVLASYCENYWLDQYQDVLPSINDRPDFPAQLTDAFQTTHFGETNPNSAHGMNLCHVMAWYDIRCRLDLLLEEAYNAEAESDESNDENYEPVRTFLYKLFEQDNEAVVQHGAWYPPIRLEAWDKPSKPWYEQTPYIRPQVGDYMGSDLEDLRDYYESAALAFLDPKNTDENINFWKETHEDDEDKLLEIREQNANAIKDLFLWANGSPSNLRYGDSSSNSAISSDFDPMGDTSGFLTAKESLLIEKYVFTYEAKEFDGDYYLRSSTGAYQPETNYMNHWYIKCKQNNEKCF